MTAPITAPAACALPLRIFSSEAGDAALVAPFFWSPEHWMADF